jgi:hypothetical protein
MEVVDGQGQLHIIDDPKVFTHLGVLGIVSTITLRCVPLFFVKQSCYKFEEWGKVGQLFQDKTRVDQFLGEYFSVMMRISFRDAGHSTLVFLRKAVGSMDKDYEETFLGAPLLLENLSRSYTGGGSIEKTTYTGYYDEVLPDHSTRGKATDEPTDYFQAEYFMPAEDCLKALRELLLESEKDDLFANAFPSGFKLRFVQTDEQYMSPCAKLGDTQWSTAIQYSIYGNRDEVDMLLKRTEEAFARSGVTFTAHWGKLTHGGHAKINASLKQGAKLFNEVRRALDPDGCFLSEGSEVEKFLLDGSSLSSEV